MLYCSSESVHELVLNGLHGSKSSLFYSNLVIFWLCLDKRFACLILDGCMIVYLYLSMSSLYPSLLEVLWLATFERSWNVNRARPTLTLPFKQKWSGNRTRHSARCPFGWKGNEIGMDILGDF
jgi:hypothetical protein